MNTALVVLGVLLLLAGAAWVVYKLLRPKPQVAAGEPTPAERRIQLETDQKVAQLKAEREKVPEEVKNETTEQVAADLSRDDL